MGFLTEMLTKPFMKKDNDNLDLSPQPEEDKIEIDLDNPIPTGFFDDAGGIWTHQSSKKVKNVETQTKLIETYRRIANIPEVSEAISEIVDEAVFSPGTKDILALDFDSDVSLEIKDRLAKELENITHKMRLDKNIYSLFYMFYIDGQLNIHCTYNENDMGSGIQKLNVISPLGLIYDYEREVWEYVDNSFISSKNGYNGYTNIDKNKTNIFSKEEIIRIDSGIYKDNLILSNLNLAIKTANMLQTLEDMLIPMRFARSTSRRVFNVDVSNLNPKKAEEAMKKIQQNFKYKKFYNIEDGTISNQQHIASLIEDYWFPNRGGEKGTTVDTIDETGNLGELGDILYFKRKLYTALKVPTNRINDEGEGSGTFDFTDTSISREELKFYNFISRLRNQFLELFYELLKREAITKNICTEEDWYELKKQFKVKFTSENKFFEKMERDTLMEQISLYQDMEELIGKFYSYDFVFKKVFKMSDEEIKELSEQLEKEKTDPIYKRFYEANED